MKDDIVLKAALFLITAGFAVFGTGRASAAEQIWISEDIPNIAKGERIVAFDVHIYGGTIVSLPNIPFGWLLTIENSSSWESEIKGHIDVGAAATEPSMLNRFFSVESSDLKGMKLRLDGSVFLSKDIDDVRKIALQDKQFRRSESTGINSK